FVAAAETPEPQGGADAEKVDVAKPRRLARRLLQELIVRAEVGIVREQRVFLARGWREAVAPQGDRVGEGCELGPEVHVLADAGAADREVGMEWPARCLRAGVPARPAR